MRKINYFKMCLNILMAITFVQLFNKKLFGLKIHEITGLAIGAAFIIHKAIHWKWIKAVSLKVLTSKITVKTRINFIVDVLLLFSMSFIILSGAAISTVLPIKLHIGNPVQIYRLHVAVSYITLVLLGVHIGLHWNWSMSMFKGMLRITQKRKSLSCFARILVIILFVFGIYSLYSVNFFQKSFMIFNSAVQSTDKNFDPSIKEKIKNGEMLDEDIKDLKRQIAVPDERVKKKLEKGGAVYIVGENTSEFSRKLGMVGNIIKFLGCITLFSIVTYYIQKLIHRRTAN